MSNRTLPVIGSKNWGSTLNNYLREQQYKQQELSTELNDLYEQSTNTIQTVLSSGIALENIGAQLPGLYSRSGDQDQRILDGAELNSDTKYVIKGYGVILGEVKITDLIHDTESEDALMLSAWNSFSAKPYDATCVYAKYNVYNKQWNCEFAEEKATSIDLSPYMICIGVIIKLNTKYYWHYKTLKANLSTSSKKWMLDEPHASLSTYIGTNGTSGNLQLCPYVSDTIDKATLTIQALGINPFTELESASNELGADLKSFPIAEYSEKTGSISYSYAILYKQDSTEGAQLKQTDTTGKAPEIELDNSGTYRLCATAVTIDNKPLLIVQKATTDTTAGQQALFNDNDFGNLLYYADPVELYRLDITDGYVSMTASVGNGISTINANGINPHVTTLIKEGNEVRFGESDAHCFQFQTQVDAPDDTSPIAYPSNYKVTIPVPNGTTTTGTILTNTMTPLEGDIIISTKDTTDNRGIILQAGAGGSNNPLESVSKQYQLLLKSKASDTKYSAICLEEGDQIDLTAQSATITTSKIQLSGEQARIDLSVKNTSATASEGITIKAENTTASSELSIQPSSGLLTTSGSWSIKDKDDPNKFIEINPQDNWCKMINSTDSGKTITFDLNSDQPTVKLGGDTYLSSAGLYFPSTSSGVSIGKITGPGTVEPYTTIPLSDPDAKVYEDNITNWAVVTLPVLEQKTSDKILNPWSRKGPDIEIRDQITKVVAKMLLPNGEEQLIECTLTDKGRYYYAYKDYDPNGYVSWEIFIAFYDTSTSVQWSPTNKFQNVVKVEVSTSLNYLKEPIITLGDIHNAVLHIKSLGPSSGGDAVLHIPENGSKGHIYVEDNKNVILINTNTDAISIKENLYNIEIEKNKGTIKINESTGNITIKESTGNITLENAIITSLKTKIGKRVAVPTGMDIPYSVLEFYESFMSMIPIETTPTISLRNRYHKLGFPTVTSTKYNDNNYFENRTSLDGQGPTIERGYISGNTAYSYDFMGDNPRNHEWVKINIKSGAASALDGWASWNLWALTGVQNRYKWLNVDKFYFQLGKEGSSSCEYFEIDYRYGVLPTNSSYKDPLIGYMRNNWYTKSPDGSLDLTARIFIQDSMSTGLNPALADSNNLDAGLTNDIKALQYAIDADFGSSPILWHLITEAEGGAAKRYKVYLDWSTDTNYRPTKDSTGKVHAPYAYDIHWRQ